MRVGTAAFIAGIGIMVSTPEEASALEFSTGLKGGLSLTTLTGKDANSGDEWDKKFQYNFNGGIAVSLVFLSEFAIEVDCLYSPVGMKVVEKSGTGEVTRRYAYCEFPILFRVQQTDPPVRQGMYAGPFIGKLLYAKEVTSGVSSCRDGTKDLKDDTAPVNFGFTIGSSMLIEAGPGNIVIDLKYSHGLSSIDKEEEDIRTSVISFMTGYVFVF